MNKITIENKIITLFSEDKRIDGAIIHGSFEKGTQRIDSDIDLAVLLAKGTFLNSFDCAELSARITWIIRSVADIGILSSKNLVYAHEAILNGRRIFVRNQFDFDLAVASILGIYARFIEDRQEVIRAYSTR